MANYLAQITGKIKEVAAIITSAGAGDSGKIVALDANGLLSSTMMPVGVAPDVQSIITSEDLIAGDFVNIYDNASVLTARKAVATDPTKQANGFVLTASTSPAANNVYFEGKNTGANGTFALGLEVFLSSVAGEVTTTAPSASGSIVQSLGTSLSTSSIATEIAQSIQLV